MAEPFFFPAFPVAANDIFFYPLRPIFPPPFDFMLFLRLTLRKSSVFLEKKSFLSLKLSFILTEFEVIL